MLFLFFPIPVLSCAMLCYPMLFNAMLCCAMLFNAMLCYLIPQVWDLGGQTSIRPYWRCYYPNTDAIIFVVDSCDSERLGIAKQELMAMLEVR